MKQARLILETVCHETGIRESQLLSSSRVYHLVVARMLVVLLLERRGFTDERISWILNRTRATITVMRHRAHDDLTYIRAFATRYEQIKNIIDNATSI